MSKTRSATDASLIPADALDAQGLRYPCGDPPAPGDCREIAPGVHWVRMPLRWALNHVNLWMLDDEDESGPGVAIIDTGIASDELRRHWESVLAGRRITKVIVTHLHPDHSGLAGWLCGRWQAPLYMSRTEYLNARLLKLDALEASPRHVSDYVRRAGWTPAEIADFMAERPWARFSNLTESLPGSFQRLSDGDVIAVGPRRWRVMIGRGHSQEHVCLVDESAAMMISGDQVLPRISSNVSVPLSEPDSDPLGDWLESIARFRRLDADPLVLPAHGDPFIGLHARLDVLERWHRESLQKLWEFCAEPRTAVECFPVLFARPIDDYIRIAATGEALAHLRRLESIGRLQRHSEGGVLRFRQ